jgi:hypothetical protein
VAEVVVWFKDRELEKRWRCSGMKLWRMRKAGKLNSIQIGGCGPYLTSEAEVMRIEAPPENVKGPGAVPPAPEARKPKPPLSPQQIPESAAACNAPSNSGGA